MAHESVLMADSLWLSVLSLVHPSINTMTCSSQFLSILSAVGPETVMQSFFYHIAALKKIKLMGVFLKLFGKQYSIHQFT